MVTKEQIKKIDDLHFKYEMVTKQIKINEDLVLRVKDKNYDETIYWDGRMLLQSQNKHFLECMDFTISKLKEELSEVEAELNSYILSREDK